MYLQVWLNGTVTGFLKFWVVDSDQTFWYYIYTFCPHGWKRGLSDENNNSEDCYISTWYSRIMLPLYNLKMYKLLWSDSITNISY